MSSGTQVDLDWAGPDAAQGGADASPAGAQETGAVGGAYLTDEEILGMELSPLAPTNSGGLAHRGSDSGVRNSAQQGGAAEAGGSAEAAAAKTTQAEACATGEMPSWMATLAADPKHGGEAQALWREHQEFRAAFASPEEARAIKELLPGGVRDVLTLREATQSVDRIDAAIFSGDARAQSEVVAEMARANPAAFRSMFAEAARVLAGMGQGLEAGGRGQGGKNLRRSNCKRFERCGRKPPARCRHHKRGGRRGGRVTDHGPRNTGHGSSVAALRSCCLRKFRAGHE